MINQRPWREWSDEAPPEAAGGFVEAEFVDENRQLAYATVRLHYYSDERGAAWGHSTGDWRSNTYKTHHPKYHRWRFTGPEVPAIRLQGPAMVIWRFQEAPGELRQLSNHGGDEDWVALLPVGMEQPSWMESGSNFGCCSVSSHELEDGRTVYIGAHA